jgi:type IV secretion system protein VirB8
MESEMSTPTHARAENEKSYFSAALSWEAEREQLRAKSERRAWIVASAACSIASVAVIALALLAPFRRNVPYLLALDKATGNVELVDAVDDRRIEGYQELLDKHWAQRYIVARESYNYRLLQSDYDTVMNLSAEAIGRDFAKLYEGANARDVKFGSNIEMKATVLSVQLSQNSIGRQAVVRFEKAVRRVDSDTRESPQYYVATLGYEYAPTMTGKEIDLMANPLGYKVTAYRVDSELAPIVSPQGRAAAM